MKLAVIILASIAAEIMLGALIGLFLTPFRPSIERAGMRARQVWWVDRALNPRNAGLAIVAGALAIVTMVLGWNLGNEGRAVLGIALFILAPVPALFLTSCWLRSPFRRHVQRGAV